MGIVHNQELNPVKMPPGYVPRVIVKFGAGFVLPYTGEATKALAEKALSLWKPLVFTYPQLSVTPYFTGFGIDYLNSFEANFSDKVPLRFTGYFAFTCPPPVVPEALAAALSKWPMVETAYVEELPGAPPNEVDIFDSRQTYKDKAITGIGSRLVPEFAKGGGVDFVDIEQGWVLDHEDLVNPSIPIICGLNKDYFGHGASVLGIVAGRDNDRGVIGIAPDARARVTSIWKSASEWNEATAILKSIEVMTTGGVLLLEAQGSDSGKPPVEHIPAVFDAIRAAVAKKIIVIEAAGNGNQDLNSVRGEHGEFIFRRATRDSGAILVGASKASFPRLRLRSSNYGERVDCFSYGDDVVTCGDPAIARYEMEFGGTSAASAIVAGAALVLQSWRVQRGKPPYSPAEMRLLLSDPNVNTKSNATDDRIGVMPNLPALIAQETARGN